MTGIGGPADAAPATGSICTRLAPLPRAAANSASRRLRCRQPYEKFTFVSQNQLFIDFGVVPAMGIVGPQDCSNGRKALLHGRE